MTSESRPYQPHPAPALMSQIERQDELTLRGRAISVRQPWAWAIIHGGKDVENRGRQQPWSSAIGERVWIHAARTPEPGDEGAVWALAGLPDPAAPTAPYLPPEAATLGALIGSVVIRDVHHAYRCSDHVRALCSRWAQSEQWHIRVADPIPLSTPIPWRGALGLFTVGAS